MSLPDVLGPTSLLIARDFAAAAIVRTASLRRDSAARVCERINDVLACQSGAEVKRCWSEAFDQAQLRSAEHGVYEDPRIDRALAYIRVHHARARVTLSEAASVIRLSPWHAGRILKLHTGLSFRQLLIRTRMEHALKMASSEQLTSKEIADKVGYLSVAAFCRQFRTRLESRRRRRGRNTYLVAIPFNRGAEM